MITAEQTTRGNNFTVNVYSMGVSLDMRERALEFATRIIRSNNQYSRLLPREVWESNNVDLQQKLEIQRTYVGKLGEMAFRDLLRYMGKNVNTDGMFEIYEGQENVDEFDFVTLAGHSVDVKTGFRSIHRRLLINTEQFDRIPKDFYVAVWFNGVDVDAENKLIDLDSITLGKVMGYAEHGYLLANAEIGDFGEGPARYVMYDRLMGIDRLVNMF